MVGATPANPGLLTMGLSIEGGQRKACKGSGEVNITLVAVCLIIF